MSNLGLRQRVAAREPLIGTFIKTPAAHQVELLRLSGLDFVVADAEHAPIGNAEIDRMIACAGNFPVLVRVARNEASMISSVLDLGAAGVVVPHIRSTGDAHAVLDAADFSRGCRGFSPSVRAGRFGTDTPEMYRHRADGERLVIAQIEDVEALENIDAIAAIETIDVLFVGPADLGLSMGCGSPDEPRLKHAIRSVADAGRRHGRAVGIFVGAVEGIPQYRAMGISFFICGSDQSFLIGEARRVKRTAFAAEYI